MPFRCLVSGQTNNVSVGSHSGLEPDRGRVSGRVSYELVGVDNDV